MKKASVKIKVVHEWEGGFKGAITFANHGKSDLENSTREFNSPEEICKVWGAQVANPSGDEQTISSANGNGSIPLMVAARWLGGAARTMSPSSPAMNTQPGTVRSYQ